MKNITKRKRGYHISPPPLPAEVRRTATVMDSRLLSLPNELLILIAKNLGAKDLATFLFCSHHLHPFITSFLHVFTSQEIDNFTTLQWAAREGLKPLAKFVLENGAEVDMMKHPELYTALHLASLAGDVEIVQLLLDNGATVEIMDRRFETALHLAASGGNVEVVKLLLESGADISSWNLYRSQPLHLAAEGLQEDVVRLLLEKGASANLTNWNDDTPLSLAERQADSPRKETVVKLLRDAAGEAAKGAPKRVPSPAGNGWLLSLHARRKLFLGR